MVAMAKHWLPLFLQPWPSEDAPAGKSSSGLKKRAERGGKALIQTTSVTRNHSSQNI